MKKLLAFVILALAAQGVLAQSAIIRGEESAGSYLNLKSTSGVLQTIVNSGTITGTVTATGTAVDSFGAVDTSVSLKGVYRNRVTSAVATQNQVVIDAFNLHDTLSIHSACSAGTGSVQVEASADNTNWLALEAPIAAAGTVVKVYTAATVGATIALSPLSYRYIRITTASCGGGNTSTLTIGLK
jgi:hypothetical protein